MKQRQKNGIQTYGVNRPRHIHASKELQEKAKQTADCLLVPFRVPSCSAAGAACLHVVVSLTPRHRCEEAVEMAGRSKRREVRRGEGASVSDCESVFGNYSSVTMFLDFAVFTMSIYCEVLHVPADALARLISQQHVKQQHERARKEQTREAMRIGKLYAERNPPDYSRSRGPRRIRRM
eukprot:753913-Hanusia_phi.AAC.2